MIRTVLISGALAYWPPMLLFSRSTTCWVVEKSAICIFRVSSSWELKLKGTSRSTMAPPGMLATVVLFFCVRAAAPVAEYPPTMIAPWASA